jgi:LPXTG-motif cell wall-anchored protein
MKKVLVLVAALAAFAAVPAIASATPQSCDDGGVTTLSRNNCEHEHNGDPGHRGQFRDNTQSQSASAGPCSNISQQQAIGSRISQSSSQSNNCVNRSVVVERRFPVNHVVTGVQGTGVVNSGVGSGVRNVVLAHTGFDAWILVVIGGVALAGGLGILTVQRRRQLS